MTEDERLVLSTTIALHGFELYNRWIPVAGIWRPLLVGKQDGPTVVWCIREVGGIDVLVHIHEPMRVNFDPDWQRINWFELTDSQLLDFYNIVVSTR